MKIGIARFTLVLAFTLLWAGCNHIKVDSQSIEGKMGAAISQRCGKARDCTVRLSDLTPFKWDKMFYFDYGVTPSDRRRVVGIGFDTHELERQIVFLRDGRVVENEFLPTDIEKPIANQIVFATDKIDKPQSPFACDDSAIFQATYDEFGTGTHFIFYG
jgi:hypothetical protein